jgi:glycosyltransferase involved in cell wall biosynthesis
VVATRCGGPEDIVTDGVGELVEPDDAAALAGAIGRVLDRPDALSPEKLRAHALTKFGVESVVERVVELYDEACLRTTGCATALPSTGSA